MSEDGKRKLVNQCVVVPVNAPYCVYKLPLGLDLKDKTVIESWHVDNRAGLLHLLYTDGTRKKYCACWENDFSDMRYNESDRPRIEDACDYEIDFEEDDAERYEES
jgi:hypothetical protein